MLISRRVAPFGRWNISRISFDNQAKPLTFGWPPAVRTPAKNQMRSLRGLLTAVLMLSGGAGLLAAAPVSTVPVRLSLALPAQSLDFGDLDLRDSSNRPIAAPAVRQRFEDVLNRELNRLLIENLTPLHRAWIEMLNRDRDVCGAWFQRTTKAVHRWIWTVASREQQWIAVGAWRLATLTRVTAATAQRSDKNFIALHFLLISSTCLLR